MEEEHLLLGVGPLLDHAGGVDYVLERPADDGLPEVIRIVDSDEEDLPIYISSDEEEAGEYEVGMVGMVVEVEGLGFPLLSSDDEDEPEEDGHQAVEADEEDSSDDEDDEDSDDDWSDTESEDSGYGSVTEEEEDSDNNDEDGIRPDSPLLQHFPPEDFWRGWRPSLSPILDSPPIATSSAVPQQPTVQHLLEPHEVPSVFQRREECAPSTSGLSSSTKRRREESDVEEVSIKRLRWPFEEWVPLTSGLSFTKRRREGDDAEEVSIKRLRWTCEERPSTSGLGFSASRSWEESYRESGPSTSGLGSSSSRSQEESDRESAPSTSGFGSSANRRLWFRPFVNRTWADDSDSD